MIIETGAKAIITEERKGDGLQNPIDVYRHHAEVADDIGAQQNVAKESMTRERRAWEQQFAVAMADKAKLMMEKQLQ